MNLDFMNGAYVINLDEYVDVGTHWIALYVLNNDASYLDSLQSNTFLEGLSILLIIKICKQTYSKYKHKNQSCMDIFALDFFCR